MCDKKRYKTPCAFAASVPITANDQVESPPSRKLSVLERSRPRVIRHRGDRCAKDIGYVSLVVWC